MKFDRKCTDGVMRARILVPLLVDPDEWDSIKALAKGEKRPVREFLTAALQEGIEDAGCRSMDEG